MMPSDSPPKMRPGGTLALELTAACNRHCLYCYNSWREGPLPEEPPLDTRQWIELARRVLEESGRNHVQLSGGEPLLRPDLFEIVEAIRAPGRRISLVTDGGLIDDRAIEQLVRLGVGPVQPTLLAACREVHDGLKGAESFDATVGAIARMRHAGVPVSVSFVCTSKNYMYFREVAELCFALGVSTVAFSRLCAAGSGATRYKDLVPSPDMIRGCLDVAVEVQEQLALRVAVAISLPHCAVTPSHRASLSLGRCAVGTGSPGFTVDPWGRLRACSVSSTVLGDLRNESWDAIIQRSQEYFFPFREPAPMCRDCSLESRCGGGCRETSRHVNGTAYEADPLATGPVL